MAGGLGSGDDFEGFLAVGAQAMERPTQVNVGDTQDVDRRLVTVSEVLEHPNSLTGLKLHQRAYWNGVVLSGLDLAIAAALRVFGIDQVCDHDNFGLCVGGHGLVFLFF
jgi:hypothetical protein